MLRHFIWVLLLLTTALPGCALTPSKSSVESAFIEADNLYKNGKLDEAKVAFEKIWEQDQKHYQSCYRLGVIAFRQSKFEEAEQHFRNTLSIRPDFERAQYNLAVTYLVLAKRSLGSYTNQSSNAVEIGRVNRFVAEIDEFAVGEKTDPPGADYSNLKEVPTR